MWDKKIIAISDFSLVEDNLAYVEKLASAKIDAFVLREKSLSEYEYYDLAKEVIKICSKKNVHCILHNFYRKSLKLEHKFFHAPLSLLKEEPRLYRYFHILGTSIHSKEELIKAMEYKVNYAFVGHIFQSSCKKDLKPKGIEFLKQMLEISKIPLYAIGGIKLENINELKYLNIAGICIREAFAKEKELKKYVKLCKKELNE